MYPSVEHVDISIKGAWNVDINAKTTYVALHISTHDHMVLMHSL
jgi:hypothetical protein